ncbi:MAG: aminoacetone oxidase family FAD-binding enzyme, partial [Clostridia bacterium]|nr:aminoacetone oxidase family FAD-binding enzyme [Clostridia bacterium]
FLENVPRNPKFLQSSVRGFPPEKLMAFLEECGVPLTTERGRRVFPASNKASDVTRALVRRCVGVGVEIVCGARAKILLTENGQIKGIAFADGTKIQADKVILATGGLSYPATGSTGDGIMLAAACGHTITKQRPSLVPIITEEIWPNTLSGLSLKNISLKCINFNEQGELLFTHNGVSGPLALSATAYLPDDPRGIKLELNLKPALDEQTLDARLVREFAAAPRKSLENVLCALAPASLASVLPLLAELDGHAPAGKITKPQRLKLAQTIQKIPLTVKALGNWEEAVITRGGVDVREINPSTLESRIIGGLYFAGEVIDTDALTGGYNLHIAFATGALAGKSVAKERKNNVT